MEFHAQSIMQHANFAYCLPCDTEMEEVKDPSYYDRETKSIILLHGLTGTDTDWLYGGVAQMMAYQYNLAVFMPTTGNSFYLDKGYDGGNYATYVGEELPEFIHKVFGFCESIRRISPTQRPTQSLSVISSSKRDRSIVYER